MMFVTVRSKTAVRKEVLSIVFIVRRIG